MLFLVEFVGYIRFNWFMLIALLVLVCVQLDGTGAEGTTARPVDDPYGSFCKIKDPQFKSIFRMSMLNMFTFITGNTVYTSLYNGKNFERPKDIGTVKENFRFLPSDDVGAKILYWNPKYTTKMVMYSKNKYYAINDPSGNEMILLENVDDKCPMDENLIWISLLKEPHFLVDSLGNFWNVTLEKTKIHCTTSTKAFDVGIKSVAAIEEPTKPLLLFEWFSNKVCRKQFTTNYVECTDVITDVYKLFSCDKSPPKKSKTAIIVLAVILVLIIVSCVAYVGKHIYNQKRDELQDVANEVEV